MKPKIYSFFKIIMFIFAFSNSVEGSNVIYLLSTHFSSKEFNDNLFKQPAAVHYRLLRDRLYNEFNLILKTPSSFDQDMSEAKYILLFNGIKIDRYAKEYKKEQLILVTYEPPCVRPEEHTKESFNKYGKVLSWRDDLINNISCFKLWMPRRFWLSNGDGKMITNVPAFKDKKLCTMICAFNHRKTADQLFSERVKVIEFFETLPIGIFDLYGFGWDNRLKNYKGSIGAWNDREAKINCIKNYKFYICYENCHIPGYVSEKIFDCFEAGCIPIYWGATNIDYFVPKACFIDRRNFDTTEDLYNFIKNMNEQTYNDYLTHIAAYLEGDQAKLFSSEAFADSIIKCIIAPDPV